LYFQKAKKTQAGACAVQGRRNGCFLPIALVAQVVHEEKANHNQPKDQQNMMNFHGNLLFKYVQVRCSEGKVEI
jgi:hypothetical protein